MRRFRFAAILLLIVVAAALAAVALPAAGSQDDPVVSLSYLENVFFGKVKDYIEGRLTTVPKPDQMSFKLIQLKSGQQLIGGAGCEFVVRYGSAKILATAKGGVADLTAGIDLPSGSAVPVNHQLLAPIADSRGLQANGDMMVLVKGDYTVK